jgi:hypothetical protein
MRRHTDAGRFRSWAECHFALVLGLQVGDADSVGLRVGARIDWFSPTG